MRQTDRNGPPYFNPLPPHGGRLCYRANLLTAWKFQSTPSAWRETTGQTRLFAWMREFQSTPSAWRETVIGFAIALCVAFQSTPSAWRETCLSCRLSRCGSQFQSTPSAWRETVSLTEEISGGGTFQSTPSAWRETDVITGYCQQLWISIHSLRMEGDGIVAQAFKFSNTFQSTPSAWRETPWMLSRKSRKKYFNPLPPHGGRQNDGWEELSTALFQSTPSAWRETRCGPCRPGCSPISIHSLRMEGD